MQVHEPHNLGPGARGALAAAAFLGFLLLALGVSQGWTLGFDNGVLLALRSPTNPAIPRGPPWLEFSALELTALGGTAVLTVVVILTSGFLAVLQRWRHLVLMVGAALGGLLLVHVLKDAFDRPRPSIVPRLVQVSSPSFPSGHAMMSAVVYFTVGILAAQLFGRRRERIYVLATAFGLAVLIGLTRVYLGAHFPTDVLAGWLVGLAWALASALAVRSLRRWSPELRAEAPEAEGAEPALSVDATVSR